MKTFFGSLVLSLLVGGVIALLTNDGAFGALCVFLVWPIIALSVHAMPKP